METEASNIPPSSSPLWELNDDIEDYTWQHWWDVDWCRALGGAPVNIVALEKVYSAAQNASFELPSGVRKFEHIKHSEFRGAIAQLVNTGAKSFHESHIRMKDIEGNCKALQNGVELIMDSLNSESTPESAKNVKERLNELHGVSGSCIDDAKAISDAFGNLLDLAMEIQECAWLRHGRSEQLVKEMTLEQKIVRAKQEQEESSKKKLEELVESCKDAYTRGEKELKDAIKSIPTADQLAAEQTLEALSYSIELVVAYYCPWQYALGLLLKRELPMARLIDKIKQVDQQPTDLPSQTSGPDNTKVDMAYGKSGDLLKALDILRSVLKSGPNNSVDWKKVDDGGENGVVYARVTMKSARESILEIAPNEKATTEVEKLFKTGIEICQTLEELLPRQPGDPKDIEQLNTKFALLAKEGSEFCTIAKQKIAPPSLNIPRIPSGDGSSLQQAQFKIAVVSAQQDANWKLWRYQSEQLAKSNRNLDEFLNRLVTLEFEQDREVQIITTLARSTKYLAYLKDGIGQFIYFFDTVRSRISATLGPAFDHLVKLIQSSTQGTDAELVTLSRFARCAIHAQVLATAKICNLILKVSQMYLRIYETYVGDGVTKLLGLSQYTGTALDAARSELIDWAKTAQTGIGRLLAEEAETLEQSAKQRISRVQNVKPAKSESAFWDVISEGIDSAKEKYIAGRIEQQKQFASFNYLDEVLEL